jgi:hypothetical protein
MLSAEELEFNFLEELIMALVSPVSLAPELFRLPALTALRGDLVCFTLGSSS